MNINSIPNNVRFVKSIIIKKKSFFIIFFCKTQEQLFQTLIPEYAERQKESDGINRFAKREPFCHHRAAITGKRAGNSSGAYFSTMKLVLSAVWISRAREAEAGSRLTVTAPNSTPEAISLRPSPTMSR